MPHTRPLPVLPALVTVESLGGLGDGIATLDGTPVFIPKSCPGDRIMARVVHQNRDGMYAKIEELVTPGPGRHIPPCRYFDRCGGCSLQQLSPDSYREFKSRTFQNAITHAGYDGSNAEISFLPSDTRRRVEFKIDMQSGKPLLAFHEPRSHTPIAIERCLILHPQLQALIAPVNAWLADAPFASGLFALSLTLADSGTDMLLTFRGPDMPQAIPLDGVCARLGVNRINLRPREGKAATAASAAPVTMALAGYDIPLPPDAFLQATAEGQKLLTESALAACDGAKQVVDLFCGIGTYSFPASRRVKTHAAEGDTGMIQAMREAIGRHGITSLSCEARDLFKNPFSAGELAGYDAAIINPPRLGARAQCEQLALARIPRIALISCNPATFTRDARILKAAGYRMASAMGVDQFVYSPHLELTALFCL